MMKAGVFAPRWRHAERQRMDREDGSVLIIQGLQMRGGAGWIVGNPEVILTTAAHHALVECRAASTQECAIHVI